MNQQPMKFKRGSKVIWTQLKSLDEFKQKLNENKSIRYSFKVISNNTTYLFTSLIDLFEKRNCVFHTKCVLNDQNKVVESVLNSSNDYIKHISTNKKFLVPYQLFYSLSSISKGKIRYFDIFDVIIICLLIRSI